MRFYLDDLRHAPPGWTLARTFEEGLNLLEARRGEWEAISLDHDLGDEFDRTGFDFVQWMAAMDVWCSDIYVHSINGEGRAGMLAFIAEEDARRGLRAGRDHPITRSEDHTGCATTIYCWYCADPPALEEWEEASA